MKMMNPSVIVFPSGKVPGKGSRLDLMVLELAEAGIVFCRLPYGFWNIWVFIGLRGGGEDSRVPHHSPGHARGVLGALVGSAPLGTPLWYFFGPTCVFWSRKILQKVSLRLDFVWY